MVHMPSLEIREWGLKIFASAPTLTTHVDHLLLYLHMYKDTKHGNDARVAQFKVVITTTVSALSTS